MGSRSRKRARIDPPRARDRLAPPADPPAPAADPPAPAPDPRAAHADPRAPAADPPVPAADPPALHADLLAAPAADPPAPAADPPAPHADPPAPAADPPAPHADLPAPPAADPPAPAAHRPDPPAPDAPPNRYARGRARDAAIRRGLEPLAPGERPRAVTIAAIVAFVFAIANVVATLTVDDLSSGQNDPTLFAVVWTTVLVVAGAGMLARRYWAVLGFQCVLGLQIVVFSLAVTRVQKWWLAVAMTIAIGLMGWLFWKLIRPMARLQMPERPGSARS